MKPDIKNVILAPSLHWVADFLLIGILGFIYASHDESFSSQHNRLLGLLTSSLVAHSIYRDSAKRNSPHGPGYAMLAFLLWPIVGPVYLLETRGWRGAALIGLFVLLFLGTLVLPRLIFGFY